MSTQPFSHWVNKHGDTSQAALIVKKKIKIKKPPTNAGGLRDVRDVGLIPGSERPPGGGHGNPLQYSFLESLLGRGAWWAIGHGVTKNRTC